MYCPKCGKPTPDESKFCLHCGSPVEKGTPQRDTRRRVAWVLGWGLLAVALAIWYFGARKPAQRIATEAPTAVQIVAQAQLTDTAEPTTTPRPSRTPRPTQTPRPTRTPRPSPTPIVFDQSNWALLASNPGAYEGARVNIIGRVFMPPEKDANGTYWQMWSDPKNHEWNTIVAVADPNFNVKQDDYVKVTGTVIGAFEGTNLFGAALVVPSVYADTATVVDALAVAPPAVRTITLNESQTQYDIEIILEKVEFASSETRVFLTVRNNSQEDANFYDFNAKATQGDAQFDPEVWTDYPEIQSELLPSVKSSGVIVFPAMNPTKPTKFYFEAYSSSLWLDFERYVFEVQP